MRPSAPGGKRCPEPRGGAFRACALSAFHEGRRAGLCLGKGSAAGSCSEGYCSMSGYYSAWDAC